MIWPLLLFLSYMSLRLLWIIEGLKERIEKLENQ